MTKASSAVLAFCLSGAVAYAQPVSTALTWQDCVALAARNNPDLLSALQSLKASHADYKGSYNGILPQVSLSNSYSEGSRAGATTSGSWTLQGNASLNLIDFGEWANIQSALASYKQSEASARVASSSVLLDLYRAFAGLLYAQESVDVNAAILKTWKMNAQMVNLRYQSGRESKGNNMNTQAQFLQAESALEQAKRELHVSQQRLNQALGKDGFSVLAVTGTWTSSTSPTPRPDLNVLLSGLPAIQVQEALVEQAVARVKSAHSSLWPRLSLNYGRGTTGRTEFPQTPFWTFSGTVNLPIFSGGPTATYYASASAQRNLEKANHDLRSVRNQALTDLETTWSAFAEAEEQVRVQNAFLMASRQRKEESDVRYQSGLMSFEDWNRVVVDYVNFQTSFLRAEQNLILAEAQWRFTKGDAL
jgi:outer membrane protein